MGEKKAIGPIPCVYPVLTTPVGTVVKGRAFQDGLA